METGKCGTSVTYSFDTMNGIMTISGSGDMTDINSQEVYPWYYFKDAIKTVIITEGVTSIFTDAFDECKCANAT